MAVINSIFLRVSIYSRPIYRVYVPQECLAHAIKDRCNCFRKVKPNVAARGPLYHEERRI